MKTRGGGRRRRKRREKMGPIAKRKREMCNINGAKRTWRES